MTDSQYKFHITKILNCHFSTNFVNATDIVFPVDLFVLILTAGIFKLSNCK